MPDEPRRIYWDSCVFLSYINGIEDRLAVLDAIFAEVRKASGTLEIITSELSIVEVAFSTDEKENGTLNDAVEERIIAMWRDTSVVKLIEYYEPIGTDARRLIRRASSRGEH